MIKFLNKNNQSFNLSLTCARKIMCFSKPYPLYSMKGLLYAILIFSSTFAFTVSGLYAQATTLTEDIGKTYKIAKEGNFPNLDQYIIALNKATLDNYRLKSKGYIMNFENGLQIEILSADYLVEKGIIKNADAYPLSFAEERVKAVFNLKDGYILEFRSVINSNKMFRNNSEK
jgi:hypothetical protein